MSTETENISNDMQSFKEIGNRINVNPYAPDLFFAMSTTLCAHAIKFYLRNWSAAKAFESKMRLPMQTPLSRFSLGWFSVRVMDVGILGVTSALENGVKDILKSLYDYDFPVEEEEEEEEDEEKEFKVTPFVKAVSAVNNHLTVAYVARHNFFPNETRTFIWNGFFTTCIIETLHSFVSQKVRSLLESFAKEDIEAEIEDSDNFWNTLKALCNSETFTDYGREYIMRHFRDLPLSLSTSTSYISIGFSYFVQNYYLQKACNIFGRYKAILKQILIDVLVSAIIFPLTVVKYSQIKAAHLETLWESSAIEHAKSIKENYGWLGFYHGFNVMIMERVICYVTPAIAYGLTDWCAFIIYKYLHPRSGLPVGNPLWQTSTECSSSGSNDIVSKLSEDVNMEGSEILKIVEESSGISHSPKGDNDACCVCMERQRSLVFLPCRHLVTCMICGSQLETCPICREKKRLACRIFW